MAESVPAQFVLSSEDFFSSTCGFLIQSRRHEPSGHRFRRARARVGLETGAVAARYPDVVRAGQRGDSTGANRENEEACRVCEYRRGGVAEAARLRAGS